MSEYFLLFFGSNVKVRLSRSIEYIPEMQVDRPFLFLVFDAVTGLVLCGAVVNNLEKTKK